MAYIGAILAGVRHGQIRNIEKKLREKGAVSKRTRVTPEEAGVTSGRELGWLNYLVGQGKVGKAKDGKVWWKE